ncbi:Contactin-6 [Labeo rohita]|uniref:Contactin-6 n=1 Tax=Labeo rohita TaxID=84645 RepID=A0ABQ8LJ33_LABRO|nr:Contactin-6 [Labeo rohita]
MAGHNGHFWNRSNCKDVQCKDRNKRLRDRLKVHQNGSLTITNATITDSGGYWLKVEHPRFGDDVRFYSVVVRGFFSFDTDGVSVLEGDSVTLHTGHQMKQEQVLSWYFNNTVIAVIFGDLSKICTNERFRDRLRLHNQTGSLTIRDIRTTDSGLYDLLINSYRGSRSRRRTKVFPVAVHVVSDVDTYTAFVIEGDSVTLNYGMTIIEKDWVTWRIHNLMAGRNGYFRDICTDVHCKYRNNGLRDRLNENQNGSLSTSSATITDSGDFRIFIRRRNKEDSSVVDCVVGRARLCETLKGLSGLTHSQ